MKLSDVLSVLLSTEDEATESVEAARRQAEQILRESREKAASDQEARLTAARSPAKAIVESACHSAELEAAQISDMAVRGRQKVKDQFAEKAPEIVAKLAGEIASRYEERGRG